MAKRPWVIPEDVRNYSDYSEIQSRSDKKLEIDIARAEAYVIKYTNNKFEDCEEIPQAVHLAVILLASKYAQDAVEKTKAKKVQSETFDDYSYSSTTDTANIDISDLSLDDLLDEFRLQKASGKILMRLRKL